MELKERILQKATELFKRNGVRNVSMDEIALQLGVSKKTIYQEFKDKDELVVEVMKLMMSEKENECCGTNDNAENPIHEYFLAAEEVAEVLADLHPSIVMEMQKYHPKAYQLLKDFREKFLYAFITKNLKDGIEMGLFKENIIPEILVPYRLHAVFALFEGDVFPTKAFNIPTILNEITDNFLYGIATPKGVKLIEKYKQKRTI